MVRQRDTDGREGRQDGKMETEEWVEDDALDVFLLFHQQKPVGKKVQ